MCTVCAKNAQRMRQECAKCVCAPVKCVLVVLRFGYFTHDGRPTYGCFTSLTQSHFDCTVRFGGGVVESILIKNKQYNVQSHQEHTRWLLHSASTGRPIRVDATASVECTHIIIRVSHHPIHTNSVRSAIQNLPYNSNENQRTHSHHPPVIEFACVRR